MSAYDPPLISDADLEMREAWLVGAQIHARQKQGICCHMSAVGYRPEAVYPEQEGLLPGQLRCRDGCGAVFSSDEEWHEAMLEAMGD